MYAQGNVTKQRSNIWDRSERTETKDRIICRESMRNVFARLESR